MRNAKAVNIRDLIASMSPMSIGGHPITVNICEQGIETDPTTWGLYSPTTGQIILDHRQTDSCLASTLLHEVLHAAIETQGIVLPPGVEEHVVRVITNGLFQVFMANPKLIGILAIMCSQNELARRNGGGRAKPACAKAHRPRRP